MAKEFSKKYQAAKLHFKDFHKKLVVRVWGLAKRLDQSHSRRTEKRK